MPSPKILTIVGARPQFIKVAAVAQAFREENVQEILVHTGQHYDSNMSDIFFDELGIDPPAHNLGIGGGGHGEQTGKMLQAIEQVLLLEKPDMVLIYGDTNSTLAGALGAVKLHIPVAHVEAGLRSFNRRMPEEINRILTDHACDLLFAPTQAAVQNLVKEGISPDITMQVGDVMYDMALLMASQAERQSRILETWELVPGEYLLATIHRAENTDAPDRMRAIVNGLNRVAKDIPVVFPMHPRTRNILAADPELTANASRIKIIPPVGYLDMVMLEKHAKLIATDSGGVQKEAYFHRVRCITLREETEWVELVEHGWNRLVSLTDSGSIERGIHDSLAGPLGSGLGLYGDGHAGRIIARKLASFLLA